MDIILLLAIIVIAFEAWFISKLTTTVSKLLNHLIELYEEAGRKGYDLPFKDPVELDLPFAKKIFKEN